jgi:hypothetical protein
MLLRQCAVLWWWQAVQNVDMQLYDDLNAMCEITRQHSGGGGGGGGH